MLEGVHYRQTKHFKENGYNVKFSINFPIEIFNKNLYSHLWVLSR